MNQGFGVNYTLVFQRIIFRTYQNLLDMTHEMNQLKPLFHRALLMAVVTLGCASYVMAQDTDGITLALKSNLLLSEQLGILGPVAISPYWGLFLASAASFFGLGDNEYLMTHPFLGNWVMMILFGLSAILTSIPNITKYSKALGVASNYLEDNVSMIIVVLAIALPILHQAVGAPVPSHGEMGVLDMSLYSILMIAFSTFYMFIVTTVRLFFEVTAFVTPIPFIDTIVEVAKKVASFVLMGVYFVSPEIAMGISVVILLIAFLIFRRANTTMNYFKQIYIAPIISWLFRRKRDLVDKGIVQRVRGMDNGINATIPVWTVASYGKIGKRKKAWLIEEQEGDLFLYRLKSFGRMTKNPIERDVFPNGISINKEFNYFTILGDDTKNGERLNLRVNREYFPYMYDIAEICGMTSDSSANLQESKGSWWSKIKRYFSSEKVAVDTEIA